MASPARALEKPAIYKPLSESRALEIINALPMLVALSETHIKAGTVVELAFEVSEDSRTFVFPLQPFYIRREITKFEYLQALPYKLRRGRFQHQHYYEISTD